MSEYIDELKIITFEKNGFQDIYLETKDDIAIAQIFDDFGKEEQQAYAQLFKTSPELLETLIDLKGYLEYLQKFRCNCSHDGKCAICSHIRRISSVIRKAKGETNE